MDEQKLKLAFEYGLIFAKVAQDMHIEMTPALSAKAEEMLVSEFKQKEATQIALEMLPNILSVFETDASKDAESPLSTGL